MGLSAARFRRREQGISVTTSVPNRLPSGKNSTAEKLLVAASELMIERSSIEISLSDIAQKSGANAALVKYHFGNKDGLLLALLARDAATELSNLEYLLAQPITPILAPLAAMARAVASPRPEPPPVMRTATSFNSMTGYLSLGVSSLDLKSDGRIIRPRRLPRLA